MTRIEAMEIYKAEQDRFQKTRENQWKFNISLWTLIALGIALPYDTKAHIYGKWLYIIPSVFGIAHFLFAYLTQRSLDSCKMAWNHVIDTLNSYSENLPIDIAKTTRKVKIKWYGWLWIFFQFLATIVLLAIFVFSAKRIPDEIIRYF